MQLLLSQAQPRPNLGQQQPVATMMGRAVSPQSMQGMTLADLLRRPATEGAEEGEPLAAGGMMIGGALGAKRGLKKAFSQAAQTFDAPMDAMPSAPVHQLQKATKSVMTGEVKFVAPGPQSVHPYIEHPEYMPLPGKPLTNIIRGFRDPKTGFFYPDTHPGLR